VHTSAHVAAACPCETYKTQCREDRVCCTVGDDFVTCNLKEDEVKRLLRDELEVYSYQFKQASTVFNKGQVIFALKSTIAEKTMSTNSHPLFHRWHSVERWEA
jgi:hypothetical protein